MGDGSHGGYSGQEKGAKEQMAKEKGKAIEVKSAGTRHRLRRPSAQKLLQEGRDRKRPDHPNVARQFKPFGSANSCPQGIHSKAWYRWAGAKKFTTVECIRSLGMADKRARLSASLSAPNPECQIGCPTPPPRLVCLLWGGA